MYKFTIILLLVFFIFLSYFWAKEPYLELQTLHEKLYKMWFQLQPILEKYNIEYFADGGTLLGAYRDKKIIPHDDDIDIGILQEDEYKLYTKEFQNDLAKANLSFDTTQYVYKFFPTDNLQDVFIDLFVYERKGDKVILVSDSHRESWPNAYFFYDELFPLSEYTFGKESTMAGANNPVNYFTRQYGSDWHVPKKSHIHHDLEKMKV